MTKFKLRNSKNLLTYKQEDKFGIVPNLNAIGTRMLHMGNHKVYTITGFAWNGDTDAWNYTHVGPDGITIVRPIDHLTGNRENGMPRYVEVNY